MDWTAIALHLGVGLPYVFGFAIVAYVLVVVVAAITAMWHRRPSRRADAFKVLALLLDVIRRSSRASDEPP